MRKKKLLDNWFFECWYKPADSHNVSRYYVRILFMEVWTLSFFTLCSIEVSFFRFDSLCRIAITFTYLRVVFSIKLPYNLEIWLTSKLDRDPIDPEDD